MKKKTIKLTENQEDQNENDDESSSGGGTARTNLFDPQTPITPTSLLRLYATLYADQIDRYPPSAQQEMEKNLGNLADICNISRESIQEIIDQARNSQSLTPNSKNNKSRN